ncbi:MULTISPECIES: serine/threonine-protein kinase [Streptomyces]|uniref:non-specific serine/threonine protein kinase n=2 Tax=Streptomyces xinghaiensis TaxID=1038928 RepID=A0A3M8FCX3_9ACTN|nr:MULTISPECIES: serine/threonine-protein kinase [Streptomyces]PQM23204.1 serine/threonine protein kinase [Streptomyces xinghaiensis]RKM94765.1 serine/threonine protein kinase [Streptomyces xinghaiensis]RNC74794.1 serine/threonine protein kinase [Streptomyces xinghaiensis]
MDTSRLIGGRFKTKGGPVSGAMGDVWPAEDTKLGRTVALKFLARRRLRRQGALTEFTDWTVRRFEREGIAMARVSHPHVAHIYDTGEHDGELYIVMEYIQGRSLTSHLKTGPTLPLERTVRWTREICEGLEAAHSRKVLHHDIKPDNIMITNQGEVKIVDFGLASFTDVTQSHTGVGTPLYKAPERWNGSPGNVRSDLYSVGCVLYEMLAGRPPFGSPQDDPMTVGRMHQDDSPAPPSAHRPGVPDQFDSIIRILLAKDPACRPRSAGAVAEVMRDLQDSLGVESLAKVSGQALAMPDGVDSNTHHSKRIRVLDRRIFELELRFGPHDQAVIEARVEHAEVTGQSGDARGAAALYNRLGHDCQYFFGPYDMRALNAFEGVARWIARSGAD